MRAELEVLRDVLSTGVDSCTTAIPSSNERVHAARQTCKPESGSMYECICGRQTGTRYSSICGPDREPYRNLHLKVKMIGLEEEPAVQDQYVYAHESTTFAKCSAQILSWLASQLCMVSPCWGSTGLVPE